ncbi:hypothetical protein U8527_18510 [Kordia algicida OT-1]|uniref:Uncharacterized protein n=1 Tax=Kordia algicida OT-1 TaxID=391587 RepID=A9DIY1_9FLAO|nr:hypothetical protein [Kordia algicida]EDP97987.1 hypothetical protein KAOT1_12257 [Kordia algicida OT-1]
MKKIINLLILPMVLVLTFSCVSDDDSRFQSDPESGWIEFPTTETTTSVNNSLTLITVPVNFTAPINTSPVDVTYTIEDVVGASSDAVTVSGTVNIAANTNSALIDLNIIPTAATALVASDISFDIVLQGASRGVGVGLSDGSAVVRHRVNLVCDLTLDLGGMYSVTTNYGYHDFLPSFNPNTEVMEVVDNGDGTFFVQDFSGGLYNGGPYSTAYGTGPTSMDVVFSNSCNKIQWENQSDPWGAIIPLNGGVNEVDVATGVMTISWFCEGYGENGVSVYTPM